MESHVPKHEKIRFRRSDHWRLDHLPSAGRQRPDCLYRSILSRAGRIAALAAGGFAAFVLIAFCGLYLYAASSMGNQRLRHLAENALAHLTKADVDAHIGAVRVSLDTSNLLALDVSNVRISVAGKDADLVDAADVRFGIRLLPLLAGKLRLGSASLQNAEINPAAVRQAGGRLSWMKPLLNADGLIDPDRALSAAFAASRRLFGVVGEGSMRRIALRDIDVALGSRGQFPLHIASADFGASITGDLQFSGAFDMFGMAIDLDASAAHVFGGQRIKSLDVALTASRKQESASSGAAGKSPLAGMKFSLHGVEAPAGGVNRASASLSFTGASVDLGEDGVAVFDGALDAAVAGNVPKLEFHRISLSAGRSVFNFHGALGPVAKIPGVKNQPVYRYDFVSDGSTSAPDDSPEPALKFLARVAGYYDAGSRQLVARDIGVRTGPGELYGTGAVTFVPNGTPGLFLALNVPHMPVRQFKQLWPWFAAADARKWVLTNVFAGEVSNGRLQLDVAPGNFGNGKPLTGREASGHFEVAGTRFDTAAAIPPIRDGSGEVDFKGNEVGIKLTAGTVYLPSGRVVAASNGSLTFTDIRDAPLIGNLGIDVAGTADAVAELSACDPINALQHIGLKPSDLKGEVSGHVAAQIPLSDHVDRRSLDWNIALSYTGLSVAKPLDNETLSDADGTLNVVPDAATLKAKGKLNGVAADISLVEPLSDKGPARQRRVTLTLDEATLDHLLPGIREIVSGPVKVDVDASDPGSQQVTADLTKAKISVPWVGWSKGAGVPAQASFRLATSNGGSTISDFRLNGGSFGAAGTIRLADGSLAEADFKSVRLNPGDDMKVSVKRTKGGLAVAIDGKSFDGRPLIKKIRDKPDAGFAGSGAAAVTVTATIDEITGFGGVKLYANEISYRSAGSRIGTLSVSAMTGSGGAVTLSDQGGGDRRTIDMRTADAGAVLRFLGIYNHVQGGDMQLDLAGPADGDLTGRISAHDFVVVNEPRFRSLVASSPTPNGRSLNQAVDRNIDVSRVVFQQGFARIVKGPDSLDLKSGVLRGPVIGTTFQGAVYDAQGTMNLTGTFMPVYGVNRLFADIPIVGTILGNGRDRGLIGVTYRLSGDARSPKVEVNPLSIIAPGIFRSIFEYH